MVENAEDREGGCYRGVAWVLGSGCWVLDAQTTVTALEWKIRVGVFSEEQLGSLLLYCVKCLWDNT